MLFTTKNAFKTAKKHGFACAKPCATKKTPFKNHTKKVFFVLNVFPSLFAKRSY